MCCRHCAQRCKNVRQLSSIARRHHRGNSEIGVCCVLCAVCCVLCIVCCVLCAVCCVLCVACVFEKRGNKSWGGGKREKKCMILHAQHTRHLFESSLPLLCPASIPSLSSTTAKDACATQIRQRAGWPHSSSQESCSASASTALPA